jgi:TonB family protein
MLCAPPAAAVELVVRWAPLAVPVDAYQVERRRDEGEEPFTPVARVGGGETRFVDRSVTTGSRYCYRVRGVRSGRVSPPSPPLCNVASEPVRARPAPGAALLPVAAAPPQTGEDRGIQALRRPPPRFPPQAQLDGISGWVRLSFTVAADGTTRDIRVTAAEPSGVFEDAAVEAASRFVYLPRLANGVPVDQPNVETEITFSWIDRGGSLTTGARSRAPR